MAQSYAVKLIAIKFALTSSLLNCGLIYLLRYEQMAHFSVQLEKNVFRKKITSIFSLYGNPKEVTKNVGFE